MGIAEPARTSLDVYSPITPVAALLFVVVPPPISCPVNVPVEPTTGAVELSADAGL